MAKGTEPVTITTTMGYRSSRKRDSNKETDQSRRQSLRTNSKRKQSSGWTQQLSLEEATKKYGIQVRDQKTMVELQRAEASNPLEFQSWLDEGMTAEIMCDPHAIKAFRERQEQRPAEVPTDIERRNKWSAQRSADTAAGPAGETGVPDSVRDVITSSGQALEADIQRAMEEQMGDSLGDVRIHTGAKAANACESINARAFTVGNHVVFNHGEYDPSSPEGQHVIVHELAHVRQQTGGEISMLPQEELALEIDPDEQLEREAEEMAQRVMAGGELGIQRLAGTKVHVQRMSGVDREETYDPGSQAGGGTSGASEGGLSSAVTDVKLGADNLVKFQQATVSDIQTLYEELNQQKKSIMEKLTDASAGEAIKMGATEFGKQSGVPFGKAIGSLAGAALQAIYNNRDKVLEILGLKSESVDDGEAETGSGDSRELT